MLPEAEAETFSMAGADDAFRAWLPPGRVAAVMRDQVEGISYPNVKSSIRAHACHDPALAAWGAMHRYKSEQGG